MTREQLQAMYLDYVNNYLTVEKWAEHNGLYVSEARTLLDVCRQCHENQHPEA